MDKLTKSNRKDIFDNNLRELYKNDSLFGFRTNHKPYPNYFSNEYWTSFVNEMKAYKEYYDQYNDGSGGELKITYWRGVKEIPPKMCSVASSSRFIFMSLRDDIHQKIKLFDDKVNDQGLFGFEYKLPIKGVDGAKANLDAAYFASNKTIFFEAKCHEIFDDHSLAWKDKYFVPGVFYDDGINSLNISKDKTCKTEYRTENRKRCLYRYIDPAVFGLTKDKELRFDVKQFVCHLLGISNDNSKNKELIYFLFKPDKLDHAFDPFYHQFKREFECVCNSKVIKNFCEKNNIKIKLFYSFNDTMDDELKIKEEFHN